MIHLQGTEKITEYANEAPGDPLISVCVQTYQHVNYIKECLDGILMQQTTFDFEIVLGEDASDDGTRQICIDYAEKYPQKIRLFLHDRSNVVYIGGLATPRYNFLHGVHSARGKYIAICEGDDYWTDPMKLEKQAAVMEQHPEYSLCVHAVKTIYEDVPEIDPFSINWEKNEFTFTDAIFNHFIPTLSILFPAKYVNLIPEWYTRCIVGDKPLLLFLLSHGNGYFIHEAMGVKRKHKGGITAKKRDKKVLNIGWLNIYERINAYTHYKHKRLLNACKIAPLELSIAKDKLAAWHFLAGAKYLVHALFHGRTAMLRRVFHKYKKGLSQATSCAFF